MSSAAREFAAQLAAIRDAAVAVQTEGPTPLAVGTLFAATLVATDLQQDPDGANDNDLRWQATFREFRRHAIDELMPVLEDELLAGLTLSDGIEAPPPVRRATPVDLARCLMAICRLVDQPRGNARIGIELARRVERHARQVRDLLEQAPLADLPLLAANQRRIGLMLEVLDLLGDDINGPVVRQHSRILARAALRWVTATLEGCLVDAALRTRFDLLATTDDFLAITRRVIEGVAEEYDPISELYPNDLGMAALSRFAVAMLAIEHKTLTDCLEAVERADMPAELFGASLRLLAQIHGLGRAILAGCRAGTVAVGAARAAERAEQLLRPRELVDPLEAMTHKMDWLLTTGSQTERRSAYAALFEGFKTWSGLPAYS